MKREMTRADIMDMAEYATVRKVRKAEIVALKRTRRMEVGPFAAFHFESFDTMWHQVHEMLFIERGGEAQIDDELIAYNPLIPDGSELVATIMFEIDDPARRAAVLGRLGGVEETVFLRVAGERICGHAEADVERTTAAGKASSVQFVHFPFTHRQTAAFSTSGAGVVVGFDHPEYRHMAMMPERVRAALAEDFDG